MKINNDITEVVGNTPLLRLNNLIEDSKGELELLLKLEMFNPGGSVKDRIAKNMIETAEEKGKLKPGDTIVEPTSGNTGIGLALIGMSRGYQVILTMPDTMSQERRNLLQAYGAELILTPGEKGMQGAIDKAESLANKKKNYYMPRQFENPANPEVHSKSTGPEILKQTAGKIDYFVSGVGTGGTITGVSKILKSYNKEIKTVAVEPRESAVLSGEKGGSHAIQGIGAGFIPKVLEEKLLDRIIAVSGSEARHMARKLAKKEGLLAGFSTGANLAASFKLYKEIKKSEPKNKVTIVTLAPDTGERYLSTDLFN